MFVIEKIILIKDGADVIWFFGQFLCFLWLKYT